MNNPSASGLIARAASRGNGPTLFILLLLVAIAGNPFTATAQRVLETALEFHTSADFNGDSRLDVLVLDRATGNARVGYQNAAGALEWSAPLTTGVEDASAVAVGRFGPTNHAVIAVTSETLNRIHIINLSNRTAPPPPFVMNPAHPSVSELIKVQSPYGAPGTRDWISANSHDPGITLLDLFEFVAEGITAFSDQIAAEGRLESAAEFTRGAGDVSLIAGLRRGTSNDTFLAFSFTNTAAPLLVRSNLPAGTEYVFGRVHNELRPRLLFFVPGQSNIVVHSIVTNAAGLVLDPGTLNTLTGAVQRVFFVDEGTNGTVVVQFGNGIVGMRPPTGNGTLQTVFSFGSGLVANLNGIVPFGTNRFIALARNSNSVASVEAQVFTKSGGTYTAASVSTLPQVTTAGTRGNVWLFQAEPFLSTAAQLIGSLNAPAWSSAVLGFPGSLAVRAESDLGTANGLGNPGTNHFGVPPAGAAYVLPNQYRADMSFFGYAPPQPVEPSIITIAPAPGSYGGPIQVSFSKQNVADDIFYRINSAAWENYFAPFLLTEDASVEYYGQSLSGLRSRTQLAFYDLGSTNPPPEPLIDLDLEPGTNTPPLLSTNFLQISANGTVFYSRRSALAAPDGLQGPAPYAAFSQSPFNAPGFTYFHLENFEDNAFNVPGATPSGGWIVSQQGADSVDSNGRSYYSAGQGSLTISFNAATLDGRLPTHAGVVWTDVGQSSGTYGFGNVTFTAVDANGNLLGSQVGFFVGDGQAASSQGEDRFLGVVSRAGIASITISMPGSGDWEIDHVQFGHLNDAGFEGSIWAINLDGSGETFITRGHKPRVTADGKRMAFLRDGPESSVRDSLWLRDLQTGLETPFFTNANSSIVGLDWRRSQTDLVFDYGCSIWTRSLGGNLASVPFPTDCFADAPVASPADDRLAFHVLGPNGPPGIYVTPSNWSVPTPLPLPFSGWRWPSWSPNGAHLLLADGALDTVENHGTNLWIVNADGTHLRQITALSGPGNGFPRGAIWKPDASCVVGAGTLGGTNGLWLIPLAANGESCHCIPRRLPTSAGDPIDFAGSIVVARMPQPVAPSGLFIRTEPGVVIVYWSTDYEGFTLESTLDLADPEWMPIHGPYFLNGSYYEYRESRHQLSPTRYFRLRHSGAIIITPPNPQLSLNRSGNQTVLTWPLSYAGFTVEWTTNLAPNAVWLPVPGPYGITNGVFELRRNLPGANRAEFYRLRW